ncbi:hypothetical protein KTR9_0058 [Gordonia sp. KTR9]|nr:hypothetical protein KTR9_0058 [Gordonia sp. KTR9]
MLGLAQCDLLLAEFCFAGGGEVVHPLAHLGGADVEELVHALPVLVTGRENGRRGERVVEFLVDPKKPQQCAGEPVAASSAFQFRAAVEPSDHLAAGRPGEVVPASERGIEIRGVEDRDIDAALGVDEPVAHDHRDFGPPRGEFGDDHTEQ